MSVYTRDLEAPSTKPGCTTCDEQGRGQGAGYCARLRCYCGHPTCHAFASWVDPKSIPTVVPKKGKKRDARQAASWDEREEPTWLDQ